ncbi:putative G-protein coupled receptors family 1 profile domain-containing protein [Seiridium unicorne]|uniref:G-protein coupled receptors family 1 profile domain-containing protein n=1 Tax=Seiridium unicorne TaxID=138068 RepID=A0ABR2UX90_9PEZI
MVKLLASKQCLTPVVDLIIVRILVLDLNLSAEVLAPVAVAVGTLVTFCGLVRVYSLLTFVKKVHLEDYLALTGFLPFIAVAAVFLRYIQDGGYYVHQWDISARRMLDGLSFEIYIFGISFAACMLFVKPAVLFQWKRIFIPTGARNGLFWAIHGLIVLNTLLYIAGLFATAFGCEPIRGFWDATVSPRKCISHKALQITATCFNAAIDIAIFLLPQPTIWRLQMSRGRKIGLALMFSVGLLSCTAALGHVHSVPFVNFSYPSSGDSTYTTSPLFIWCLSELTGVYLVYLMPSIPRAIGESAPFHRLVSTFKSWTRQVSSKSHSTFVRAFPRTIGSVPGSRVHRLADEDGQALGLAELRLMQQLNEDSSITKTTVVDQFEDDARRSEISTDRYKHQHPWMEV